MGLYVLCPFFIYEKRLSISCEDGLKYFTNSYKKDSHIKKYCEAEWEKCKYAEQLMQYYERTEDMTEKDKEIQALRLELKTSKENNHKILSDNGRMRKKIKKMNEVAKANHEMYEQSLRDMEDKIKLMDALRAGREWAESCLAAILIKTHEGQMEFDVDLKELQEIYDKYHIEFVIEDEDSTVAHAKVTEK